MTERLGKKIWSAKIDDESYSTHFCLKALEALKISTKIEPTFLPRDLQQELQDSGDCFFMPTVRTDYKPDEKINPDALYITYNTDIVPFHKLNQFVAYFQTRHIDSIRFKRCNLYNVAQFDWVQESSAESDESGDKYDEVIATISIVFNCKTKLQSGVVEVTVDMEPDHASSSLKPHIYSVVKTACVEIFHQIASESPRYNYRLAVPCPLQSNNPSKRQKPHLLKFQILRDNSVQMYCCECEKHTGEAEADRLPWVNAAYVGPAAYSVYNEGTYVRCLSCSYMCI